MHKTFTQIPPDGRGAPVVNRKDAPPCRAVVATDYAGKYVTVLEYIGSDLDRVVDRQNINEFFRDRTEYPGAGIWMWVGKVTSDGEPEGSFRSLTPEEVQQSMSGDSPWDPDLWYDRTPEEPG